MMNRKIITTILFSSSIIGILYFNIDKKHFIEIGAFCTMAVFSFFINLKKPTNPPQKSKKKKEAYINDINYRGTKS
jgi:hypothetical protein